MEENAPVHTTILSRNYQANHVIKKIDNCPAQSPNLNPIENVWKDLKVAIQTLYNPQSIPELKEAISQAWDDYPTQTFNHLLNSRDGCYVSGYPFGCRYPMAISAELHIRIPWGISTGKSGYPRISAP
jgi:hypothetical protein